MNKFWIEASISGIALPTFVQAGIDEAGRGPVLGPLVVAGVAVADPAPLSAMGCRDSKTLSPDRRRALDRALRALPGIRIEVREVSAEDLDLERQTHSLNDIELARFQDIGRALGASTLYVDAADVDAARFGRAVAAGVPGSRVVSEHKADARHAVVAAASIVAKVARDAAIAQLARRLERRLGMELGSGYPSDARTRAFLASWSERFGDLPEGTRRSWATARALRTPRAATLDAFGPRGDGGAGEGKL